MNQDWDLLKMLQEKERNEQEKTSDEKFVTENVCCWEENIYQRF